MYKSYCLYCKKYKKNIQIIQFNEGVCKKCFDTNKQASEDLGYN